MITPQQALLISLLLGQALNAILVNVSKMTEAEVDQNIATEEAKSSRLLDEMRKLSG